MVSKLQMVASARTIVRQRFPNVAEHAACLYFATAIIAVAQRAGLRLTLQAGTAYWPRVTPLTDDGVEPDVFGYEWSPDDPASRRALAMGYMPEMHVWAGDPVNQEVVDLTTGYFPKQCKALTGMNWKAPKPPDFFWGPFDDLPRLATYRANRDATLLALQLFRRATGQIP